MQQPKPEIISENVDFILSHFQEPLFPRRIMTKRLGYQKEVFSKQEVLNFFKLSHYEDCRINAYPSFTNYHGINRVEPRFLIIDLDLRDFGNSRDKLDRLHPDIRSVHLESIEHHIKYKDPEIYRLELLKLLNIV